MKKTILFLTLITIMVCANTGFSIPVLQIYVEGAVYDVGTETWVFEPEEASNIRLWVIGNVAGYGPIYDLKLSIAYDSNIAPTFTLTPSKINATEYPKWTDPSTPIVPIWKQTNASGDSPLMGGGASLPDHGIYKDGVTWQEFSLGNLTKIDSPIGDFINSFPTPSLRLKGQINVYELSVEDLNAGDTIHFDVYDHVVCATDAKYKFAPFSHDGEGTPGGPGASVPEPSTLLLLGSGICTLALYARARRMK
jgi:hypothetical protein